MIKRVTASAAAVFLAAAIAAAQMPDLRQMAGQPLPSADLPAGTVTVRVVRGGISNNVAGAEVVVAGEGPSTPPVRVTTDQSGRAAFPGLPVGTTFRASVTVDGERLSSQPFAMPATGGLRVLLAAGLASPAPNTAAPAAKAPPAAPGSLTLGGQSRLVFELAEGSIEVFCLVEILNPASGPVMPAAPIAFELPSGAVNASVLEGSTPLARAEGARVIVNGPLGAGTTNLQFAYRVPTDGPMVRVRQVLPLSAPQATVIVRKLPNLTVSLVAERGRRDVPLEGRSYVVINGDVVVSGGTIDVTLSGLPAHPRWPRLVALGLASAIVLVGGWLAVRRGASPDDEPARLRVERAERFDELVHLERRSLKQATPSAEALERRRQLVEQIAELDLALEAVTPDASAVSPTGTGEPAVSGARTSTVQ